MGRGRKSQYTPERVEIITTAIKAGKTYKDAYTAAGISNQTFHNWMNDKVDFLDAVKKAEQEYNEWYNTRIVEDSKRSLVELIQGTTIKTTKTITRTVKGVSVTETVVEEKQVAPNPTAIIFALTNRAPEQWKNRQTTDVNANVNSNNETKVDLSAIPDELLEQVLNKINGGE